MTRPRVYCQLMISQGALRGFVITAVDVLFFSLQSSIGKQSRDMQVVCQLKSTRVPTAIHQAALGINPQY